MSIDNPYYALAEVHGDEARWAYGTGFTDPLSTVDTSVPSDVDRADLALYCTMLGDDALILSQRLSEWCARAPELEEDVALANIALDLLGQARLLLSRAGFVEGRGRDEDALAYLRDADEFRSVQLSEVDCGPGPGGDFATTIARLLVLSTWRLALFERLAGSRDPVLAAVAAKGAKELAYHRDHAVQWTLRLGDGTAESHRRIQAGLEAIWPLVGELFAAHPVEQRLAVAGVGVDPATVRQPVDEVLDAVLPAATMRKPASWSVTELRGRNGVHTEALAPLLAEMQSVARAHQGATW
jgi:ring-1,2-phenylacetyl-CoA epoxidase subunit PaaC